ncbi:hypothetical protein BC831DRAFT_453393 [Entophlyctis helioformis]|nr:hypothetical protein BC831DRAFT_453393 [Entophlyctis helioformis]
MSAKSSSWLTTHVLDTANGVAAAGVSVLLERCNGSDAAASWAVVGAGTTNADGRCTDLTAQSSATSTPGTYRLTFETGKYFGSMTPPQRCFFPVVVVVITVPPEPQHHYHVPVLLSNFSYSTYRGT